MLSLNNVQNRHIPILSRTMLVLQCYLLAGKSTLVGFFSAHIKQGLQKMLQLGLLFFKKKYVQE